MIKRILGVSALCAVILALGGSPSAAAQIRGMQMEFTENLTHEVPEPYKDDDEAAAIFTSEPYFKKVTFLKLEEPMSLTEQVDRLLFGIITDVPPEYDHYGYEIRRYMQHVGNAGEIEDAEYLDRQRKNIKKALIILDFWNKALQEEIRDIERIIEERNETSSVRTIFKYNRGIVNAFMTEARNWLENNLAATEYLIEIGAKSYRFNPENSILYFRNQQHLREFSNIYTAKIMSLREVREYLPYRMMIY